MLRPAGRSVLNEIARSDGRPPPRRDPGLTGTAPPRSARCGGDDVAIHAVATERDPARYRSTLADSASVRGAPVESCPDEAEAEAQ